MNVAAVDIGTNSVRLLIADQNGVELERTMRMTRLGQGVDVSGSLDADAIARTVSVLIEYRASSVRYDVSRLRAVATSAARDAKNSRAFFDAAERALGVRPELLSGEEEASLSFRGATAGLNASEGPFLVIDIGGGSTEFVLGVSQPEALISLQMGCVRMAERYFVAEDPPTSEQVDACLADVRGLLSRVREVIDVRRARRVLGLAGTVTALAALTLGLRRYDASQTHHSVLTRAQVEAAFALLIGSNLDARRKLLAEPQRAEVILGGAAVLLTILREFSLPELLVSEHDILDGLAASLRT
jgi:exopolyphosphatase/guanosine-5'-triphosphate,3'-diphosphate pyrophosphatase